MSKLHLIMLTCFRTKMKHFDMMEGLLSKEKEHLEKCRQKLRGERLELAEARTSMGESTSKE